MGISYSDFKHMTPRKVDVLLNAYHQKRKIQDEHDYAVGIYTYEAVSLAIRRFVCGDKNAKYLKQPMLRDMAFTEEEAHKIRVRKQQEWLLKMEEQRMKQEANR